MLRILGVGRIQGVDQYVLGMTRMTNKLELIELCPITPKFCPVLVQVQPSRVKLVKTTSTQNIYLLGHKQI